MIEVFLEVFMQQAHAAIVPIVRALAQEDRYPRLAEIAVPTVVMVGSGDRTTPPSHARRLTAGIPDARLITVPDAGHLLNWEAPTLWCRPSVPCTRLADPPTRGDLHATMRRCDGKCGGGSRQETNRLGQLAGSAV